MNEKSCDLLNLEAAEAKLHEAAQEIETLTARLTQARELQQLTENNEVRWMRKHSELEAKLAQLEADRTTWQAQAEALRVLVDRLEAVHADDRYKAVWVSYQIHGGRYTDPRYSEELKAARALLDAATPQATPEPQNTDDHSG